VRAARAMASSARATALFGQRSIQRKNADVVKHGRDKSAAPHPMEHLGTEYVSQTGDAALVEQRGRSSLGDVGKICTCCAAALRTTYLAPSRTRQLGHHSACAQTSRIRSAGWERK
jgi:hypothetical protein